MAEPWEWTADDLLELITQKVEENTELDFKRCAAMDVSSSTGRKKTKDDLSKDVSAFANAAGGTIVYGLIEQNHVAAVLDHGYDPQSVTREWIEQIINSNIRPRVQGVRVRTVPLKEQHPGQVAYVVWVPRGITAHQANDNRYYRRHGTENLAMEDAEIRDVMNRAASPNVSLSVRIDGETRGEVRLERDTTDNVFHMPPVSLYAVNDELADVAEYSWHRVYILSAYLQLAPNLSSVASTTTARINRDRWHTYREIDFRLKPDEPLFPGEERPLMTLEFVVPTAMVPNVPLPLILWRSRAARSSRANAGAVVFAAPVLSDCWTFEPKTPEELEALGFRLEFGP